MTDSDDAPTVGDGSGNAHNNPAADGYGSGDPHAAYREQAASHFADTKDLGGQSTPPSPPAPRLFRPADDATQRWPADGGATAQHSMPVVPKSEGPPPYSGQRFGAGTTYTGSGSSQPAQPTPPPYVPPPMPPVTQPPYALPPVYGTEPSGAPYGAPPGEEGQTAPGGVAWPTTPSGHSGYQSAGAIYGGPAPSVPPRRSSNVVVAAAIGAVMLAGGSFLAGRLTAPKSTPPVAAEAGTAQNGASTPGAAPGQASAPTSAVVPSAGFTVTDPAGDAVPHPSDGKVYGPSDITNLSVRSDGTNLVISIVYTPSTPMNLVVAATRIRLDPDKVPNCKDSVLDSFNWSIDYDATGGIAVLKPGASCGDHFQSTSITGAADVTDYTLTIKIAQASLGIRPGQQIVTRTCVSTRIDDGHTTFIQDWAPDNPSGTTGTV